uniref:Uncharacterized protein n=1 Tax=Rhizophora mucronata TaxID=61149 RepID=A0A2P2IHM5_RHIMU
MKLHYNGLRFTRSCSFFIEIFSLKSWGLRSKSSVPQWYLLYQPGPS